MTINELLTELTFYGSPCTKDCSGHRAGWNWSNFYSVNNPEQCNGSSDSFNKGCNIAISQRSAGRKIINPSVRGDKGRFVAYTGRRNPKTEPGRKRE
jgi:hypothetical protein